MHRSLAPLALVATLIGLAAASCGDDGSAASSPGRPSVVVTLPVLGSLVEELVGDRADVEVLMPNGADPHGWQPSAKDVEEVVDADLVVANGLGLEQGLAAALESAERDGVPVFEATDHVRLRTVGEDEGHEHAAGKDGDEHAAGAEDPHVWTDPVAMKSVVAALAGELERGLGLELSDRAAEVGRRLDELDAEIEQTLAAVPPERRKLVTGHESMGYFADRYGFALVGTVVPSLSSQGEASARDLAELKELVERERVGAIFTEIGTATDVVEAIAGEAGVAVVELPSHTLPDGGSYAMFMRGIATAIASALG